MRKQYTGVRLPPTLREQIAAMAADEGRNLSQMIVRMLEECSEQRQNLKAA